VKSLSKTVRDWTAAGAIRGEPMAQSLTQIFGWACGKAVDGIPGFEGAETLAAEYAARHSSTDAAVKALIVWHSRMPAVAGFATGCGGFVALPLALPANIAGTLYLQTRLIAAIAHLHGHDIRRSRVRMLVLACLSGSKAADTLRDAGIRFGTRLGRDAIGWAAPTLYNKSPCRPFCLSGHRELARRRRARPVRAAARRRRRGGLRRRAHPDDRPHRPPGLRRCASRAAGRRRERVRARQ
jgi:hypothetical protein